MKEGEQVNKSLMFSSVSNEWATPQDLFDSLNKEFNFTLDPCASEENHKCDLYFTMHDDGLKQSWAGHRVFCNPPYGREIAKWVKKASDESENALVVLLIPARTDTVYFHDYIYNKAEVRFIRGRLKFNNHKNAAPFPSMIVIFRK